MKLYSVDRSPFAARVRCAIYHKGLDVPCVPPPDPGVKGDSYLSLNPLGKLPTLVLADGRAIPESEVIVDYLEQAHPEPALLPRDPAARARARLLARLAELYVLGPLFDLFPQLDPARRDLVAVEGAFGRTAAGAQQLEGFLSGRDFAFGDRLTLADCMTVPTWFWVGEISSRFGRTSPLEGLEKTGRCLQAGLTHPVLGRVWREMADDLAALRVARG